MNENAGYVRRPLVYLATATKRLGGVVSQGSDQVLTPAGHGDS
ncbi:MAG: hypothetical protein QOG53_1009 [Frankiales bacterium]|jgi:hypothetical protein|nr:hypothetical protein [Frankiales bacterium]